MTDAVIGARILTEQQQTFYRENGYLLLPNLVRQPQIDAFNQHIWSLRADPDPPSWVIARQENGAVDAAERFAKRLFNPHLHDEFALRMMKLPEVGHILSDLLGAEAVGVQSMYFYKVPGTPGQANHQDYYYIKNELNTLTACWIAMEDADEENGCLWVIPGSHNGPLLRHGRVRDTDEHEHWTDEVEGADVSGEIPVRMKAGEALFFHNLLIHSSTKNRAVRRSRRSYVCHYIRHDSVIFRQDLHKKIYFDHDEGEL